MILKSNKYFGCLLEIFLALILVASTKFGDFDSLYWWLQILVIVGIGYLIRDKFRKNPIDKFYRILGKAKKCKDKNKAIELLEEALKLDQISKEEKVYAMEDLAEIYSEMGEPQQSMNYYNKALELLKNKMETNSLSDVEKMETLGRLSIYYFNLKNYEQAAYYLDQSIEIGLNKRAFYLNANMLRHMVKTYLASNQRDKAMNNYKTLVQRKKCKRNEEIEQLLNLDEN